MVLALRVKSALAKLKKQDGRFFGAVGTMLAKDGAMAFPWITKPAAPLATGLSGAASYGVNQMLGSWLCSVPQDKVDKLIHRHPILILVYPRKRG